METRVAKKVNEYQLQFKTDIQKYLVDNKFSLVDANGNDSNNELLQYIFDYNNIELSKDDFKKRKRVKNQVPHYERCVACRANGEQCTRRRKDDNIYCGTHIKGTPHGKIDTENNAVVPIRKIEVWVQEIKGINYYIDAEKNVYLPQDIISNSNNPRIIGKWELNDNKEYCIPSLDQYNEHDNSP